MIQLNVSFKSHIRQYILDNLHIIPSSNTKYTLDHILDVIEYVLITGASWRSIQLPLFNNYIIICNLSIIILVNFHEYTFFKKVYLQLLDSYYDNINAAYNNIFRLILVF